jgi:two-component system chemotaxis sensor kinase CheA
MTDQNQELLARLLVTFRSEATEHVQAMSSGFLQLENTPIESAQYRTVIETIFRQAHSLKGAARAVKFKTIESLCQPLESIFVALRDHQIVLSTGLVDLLHRAVRLMEELTKLAQDEVRAHQPQVSNLVRKLERALARARDDASAHASSRQHTLSTPSATTPSEAVKRASSKLESSTAYPESSTTDLESSTTYSESSTTYSESSTNYPESSISYPEPLTPPRTTTVSAQIPRAGKVSTVRIATAKLDAVMRLAEEILTPRLALEQRVTELQQVVQNISLWRKQSTELQRLLRPLQRELAQHNHSDLRKLLDYLADEPVRLRVFQDQLTTTLRTTENNCRTLATTTENLQGSVKEMQLLPCAPLLEFFALQARELAREQHKSVVVNAQGGNIEVDRRLLEEIKDPLIHLVRNCIDHGIEPADQRHRLKKSPQGNITIALAQHDSGKITLTIADDGAGIDLDRLKVAAVKRNLVTATEAEQLSDTALRELIFRSGLSTNSLITDVSGRGVGMAIVREKIEQLGGSISVASSIGHGTTFTLILPISLATFRGMLITLSQQTFIIPSVHVDCALRIAAHEVHHVNQGDTVNIHGQALALVRLHDLLGLPRAPTDNLETLLVVVLGRGEQRVAFQVDEVLGEQEVLVKGLGPQLRRVPNIVGASVLGNGAVAPILQVTDLLDAAMRPGQPRESVVTSAPARQQTILVAEDSITSRSLMKNILEAAGYQVATAVDGLDAYTTLKTQPFDLLVSDVDMPRMSGFDLTAKLRADAHLAELPVILVTTLDSRADRERGIDVGANAYIVKSSFDQDNLLEVIQRLI